MSLHIKVVTPNGTPFDGDAAYAYVPSTNGPLGIYPGHTSLIASIKEKGVLRIGIGDHERFFLLEGGALEVKPSETVILSSLAKEHPSLEEAKEASVIRDSLEHEGK